MESRLVLVLILVSLVDYTDSCVEEERFALFRLQENWFRYDNFSTWNDKNPDCCRWERVRCHNVTKRVAELHLEYSKGLDYNYLNVSLFSSFKQLQVLVLKGNYLHDLVNEGFSKLKSLSSLRYLDLSDNELESSFAALGLCELVQLHYLDLQNNNFAGELSWCLSNLTSLQVLNINSNHFHGNISSTPLTSLISIQSLDNIGRNQFHIPISLEPFFNHSKLKVLNAMDNKFYADPDTHTHSMPPKFQLEQVMLSGCRNSTKLPQFLYHQHALTTVYLQDLSLRDEFPNWLLVNNTGLKELHLQNNFLSGILKLDGYPGANLTSLDISANLFQGHIPAEIGICLPNLVLLDLSTNHFSGNIPENIHLPNLVFLNLSNNAIDGDIPSSLGDLKSLQILDLSNNHLSGNIPEHITMGSFALQVLSLSNNRLRGQIFSSKFNLTNLQRLLLDGNQFTGKIPDSLSNCSSLMQLSLGGNHFSGLIPGWLGNFLTLHHLIIAKNHLHGQIPIEFCGLTALLVLDLSENDVSGSLPSCFSPPWIQQVHLSRNRLQGELNDALYRSFSLKMLDMSYNYISGRIPDWIYTLSELSYLKLSHNYLRGQIPYELCSLIELRFLDFSHNHLSGPISRCLSINLNDRPSNKESNFSVSEAGNMEKENYVEITTKTLSYSYKGKILPYMSGIDLSCNKLTGEIPEQIGEIGELNSVVHVLNLSHNELTGKIPSSFSKLKELESLDLSYNFLTGSVPPELVELNALEVFRVGHNNLSGRLPDRTGQFITFEEDSYEGNPLLCGLPLPRSCDGDGSGTLPPSSVNNNRFIETDMDIFYISFGIAYVSAFLVVVLVLYLNPYWRRSWFHFVETKYYFIVDLSLSFQ